MNNQQEKIEQWDVQLTARDPQLLRAFKSPEWLGSGIDLIAASEDEVVFQCSHDRLWRLGLELSESMSNELWSEVEVHLQRTNNASEPLARKYPDTLADFYHHHVSPRFVDAISNQDLRCFQRPIVSTQDRNQIVAEAYSVGYESPEGYSIDARKLFTFASQFGLHQELHWKVIESCLAQCYKPRGDRKAFLNIDPIRSFQADYLWTEILDATEENAYDSQSIVFEISMTSLGDARLLADFANEIRRRGCEVALDNWGLENNSLRTLDLVRPDYVKVSEKLVAGKHQDEFRNTLLSGIVRTANELGITAIAEGIACQDDYGRAIDSGFQWLQGDYVGKSMATSAPFVSSYLPTLNGRQIENTVSGNCQ